LKSNKKKLTSNHISKFNKKNPRNPVNNVMFLLLCLFILLEKEIVMMNLC